MPIFSLSVALTKSMAIPQHARIEKSKIYCATPRVETARGLEQ